MSLALESLMRETEVPRATPRPESDLSSFILIGAGAALAFVLVSSTAVALMPFAQAWIVSSICYAGFIVPVYLLHRRFSFRSQALHREALPRYVAVQGLALVLASLFGHLFHGVMAWPSMPAALLVVALTSGVNFLVLKAWAFGTGSMVPVVLEQAN
jgi:putative flippase GtrA